MKRRINLKIWELALLTALCVTLCVGLYAKAEQNRLSGELIRLHVIANSDSADDQAAKLKARDAVLAILTPLLTEIADVAGAERIIRDCLPQLEHAAELSLRRSGLYYPAHTLLCVERYPTRDYGGFALPAGDYVSLRVILGEGQGKNWWCVVFPPLCMTAAEDEAVFSSLSAESAQLIRYEGEEYRVKFRLIELYEALRGALT